MTLSSVLQVQSLSGWIMQMCRFLYISRQWKTDEVRMTRMVDHLSSSSRIAPEAANCDEKSDTSEDCHFQLLLFPEGTNLTASSRAKSDAFAEKNGWEPYTRVLHPRTTGFSFLADRLRQSEYMNGTNVCRLLITDAKIDHKLDAIYDLTVAYPDQVPEEEGDLARGVIPSTVCFHIKR